MLAKFKDGYFLEVVIEDGEYRYEIYNEERFSEDVGWTEYRSIEMYYPMNEIDYILSFCEPRHINGEYELLKFETMEEYIKSFKEMNAKEIANWLNSEATDDEFAEVFALLDIAMFGRGIPEHYDQESIIKRADYNGFCKSLNNILTNIQK